MRVKGGTKAHQYRKAVKKRASGSRGTRHTSYRVANQTVIRASQYVYRDRRTKKRAFRKLWIGRLSSALKPFNTNYSQFLHALKVNKIAINRKMLSQLAIENPNEFKALVESVYKKIDVKT